MANGDVTKVVVLGRYVLPGGGNTTTGKQRQNKVIMWGEATCTAANAGIDITAAGSIGGTGRTWPQTLGLNAIDLLEFTLKSTDGAVVADDALYFFDVSHSTWLIHALEDVGVADASPPSAGDALVLSFWAIGDTGTDGVLT
ncbi:hypothetical protein LCGC14_0208810 [marine sediment metagenome]|uniref:Uncharacterized protein n=1 Tax=marine sediment metagenome TaxID=412755 RepID=A0A0F9UGP6_9ZZZZ